MNSRDAVPIACTLQPGSHKERLAWIAALARDGLRGVSRDDLRLELRYAQEVATRVRDMVGKEQECCGFLSFELTETEEDVRLTITAPERARDLADTLFEQFVPGGYVAYRPMSDCDTCSLASRTRTRLAVWLAAAVVAALVSPPYYVDYLF